MQLRPLIGLGGTVAAIAAAVLVVIHTSDQAPGPAVGTRAPAFLVPGQQEPIASGLFRGQTVILVFTPAACDCARVLRSVDAIAPKMIGAGGSRYAFIAIADPGGGTADQLALRARSFDITAGLRYAGDPNGVVARRFGVHTAGTVVVIDSRGTIRWTAIEPTTASLRRALGTAAA